MQLDENSRIAVSEGVVYAPVDGEAVLLNVNTGIYFGLDEVGTAVWQLIAQGATPVAIRDSLVTQFEVPAEELWSDLTNFVAALKADGLVTVT